MRYAQGYNDALRDVLELLRENWGINNHQFVLNGEVIKTEGGCKNFLAVDEVEAAFKTRLQRIEGLALPVPKQTEAIESVARAIFDAVDPLSGDQIGTTLHESQYVRGDTLPEQIEQVMRICRSAARAALDVREEDDA